MEKKCSPTGRGFDTFFGYYDACQADYWYHGASGGYPADVNCTTDPPVTDLSNSSLFGIKPASLALNGTYNTRLLADEAARLVLAHPAPTTPFFMLRRYLNSLQAVQPTHRAHQQLGPSTRGPSVATPLAGT
jgi:hypothetical protein